MDVVYFDEGMQTTRKLDLDLSEELCQSVKAKHGKCYQNSFLAMVQLNDPKVKYVEGYAIFYSDTFFNLWHHGWLELNGEIIDNYPNLAKQKFGIMYFPAKRYTYDEAMEAWSQERRPPFAVPLRKLIYAIRTYHNALRPENYPSTLWNALWVTTAVKLGMALWGTK